jgi:hypothetical protein
MLGETFFDLGNNGHLVIKFQEFLDIVCCCCCYHCKEGMRRMPTTILLLLLPSDNQLVEVVVCPESCLVLALEK